ncbi:unnamed protein product [Acanthosepion pharaonis]|uniref:Uncharacterized protein n=1 Tax=Acanthosepion pharaonis TaxID=158019 RepID=A0A812CSB7_ACAPH|nr:unnamed protein product [Sepia pharaonis]
MGGPHHQQQDFPLSPSPNLCFLFTSLSLSLSLSLDFPPCSTPLFCSASFSLLLPPPVSLFSCDSPPSVSPYTYSSSLVLTFTLFSLSSFSLSHSYYLSSFSFSPLLTTQSLSFYLSPISPPFLSPVSSSIISFFLYLFFFTSTRSHPLLPVHFLYIPTFFSLLLFQPLSLSLSPLYPSLLFSIHSFHLSFPLSFFPLPLCLPPTF